MKDLSVNIVNFLTAMQAGRAGRETLIRVFAPDAVYVEPFSGKVERHVGRDAVIGAIARGWDMPLPDMHIRVDGVETVGDRIVLRWTCLSPALPGGQGQGINRYRMRDGLIAELETTLGWES